MDSEPRLGQIVQEICRCVRCIQRTRIGSKQQELLYRIEDFRFKDWKDLQLDSDVVSGRLLHNRMGYTQKQHPMLLGLKPEPWIEAMEERFSPNSIQMKTSHAKNWFKIFPRERNIVNSSETSRTLFRTSIARCCSSNNSKKSLEEGDVCPCSTKFTASMNQWISKTHLRKLYVEWGLSKRARSLLCFKKLRRPSRGFAQSGNKWSNFQGDGPRPRY